MKHTTPHRDAPSYPQPSMVGRLLATLTLGGLLLALSGCNTMHGLGKDVEKAGEAIQKSSR